MKEYFVLDESAKSPDGLEAELNLLAGDGWRVICSSFSGLILEREKALPTSNYTLVYTCGVNPKPSGE